ncbi:hypothetical protein ACPCTO_16565 [Streptomyces olivoreticuli]
MKDAFKWSYLQIVQSDLMATIAIHQTDLLGNLDPHVSVCVFDPLTHETHFRRMPLVTAYRDMALHADGTVRWQSEILRIDLEFDDLTLDCEIHPEASPWGPAGDLLYADPERRRFYWQVTVPFGKASGQIKCGGIAVPIDGRAYVESGWGTAPLPAMVRGWSWLAIASHNDTMICGTVISHRGNVHSFSNQPWQTMENFRHLTTVLDGLHQSPTYVEEEYRFDLVRRREYQSPDLPGKELRYARWAISGREDTSGFCETVHCS